MAKDKAKAVKGAKTAQMDDATKVSRYPGRMKRIKDVREDGRAIAKYLLDNPKGIPEEILAKAKTLLPLRKPAGEGPRRVNNIEFFTNTIFKGRKTITEADLYNNYGLTRSAMGSKRTSALNQAKSPEDYIWISFDKGKGIYKLLGTGATPPEGYDGPMPKAKE